MIKARIKFLLAGVLALAGGLVALAPGCDDNTPTCVPATVTIGCICNTGNYGYELCSADGLEYSECICGPPPPDAAVTNDDAGTGDDASPADDALPPSGDDAAASD